MSNIGNRGNADYQTWTPLDRNALKLNVDATFSSNSRIGKFGMVVRDSTGKVCLCAVSCEGNVDSALQVELKAILFGLEVARNHFSEFIFIESDSLLGLTKYPRIKSFCAWDSIVLDIIQE